MKLYEKLDSLRSATTFDQRVACACAAALAEQLCHIGNGLNAIADALKER